MILILIFFLREEWRLLKSACHNMSKLSINELNSIEFVRQLLDAIKELAKNLGK